MIKYNDVKHITTEEFFNGNQFSIDAFNKKYKLYDDETYVQAVWRVCTEIASVEETEELKKYWAERWFNEIYNGWWHPAGSIMQGAGNPNSVSLANCTTISLGVRDDRNEWDNLESIISNTAYAVAKSAAYRQGLGVDFSRLRPKGMSVKNSSNESTGAVHWMGYIDSFGYKVGQKGRIPAMLFSLNISHPDVEEFIQVKSDYTQIQNANISVQITDDFYRAVESNEKWKLHFKIPAYKKGEKVYLDANSAFPDNDIYQKDDRGWYFLSPKDRDEEIYEKEVSAKKLFKLIAENMWKNAEPGIQNIDTAIKYSNSDVLYDPNSKYDTRILSTNACSEQYLSRDSLCVLSSIIFSRFSTEPRWYKKQLAIIAPSINRFLDNVNSYEILHNKFATPMQKLAIEQLRRTGAGFTDLGGWFIKNKVQYASDESIKLAGEFQKWYNYYLYKSTIELGKEKGNFGAFDKNKIKKSLFVQRMMQEFPDLDFEYMRNVTVSTIAPNGTLTLMSRIMLYAYGIEDGFGIYYWKRTRISGKYRYYFVVPNVVRKMFKDAGYEIPINSDTIEDTWDGKKGKGVAEFIDNNLDKVGIEFTNSASIDSLKKMDLMAEIMKWVDSSISVTYMLPEDTKIKTVEEFIMRGWKKGVKSISAFPDKKIYGIVSSIPFKELALKLKSEGVKIHSQNFDEKELKELNISIENVTFNSAPKRPKLLEADIYSITVKGEKFAVVVGLLNGVPYEMFAGHMNGFNFKFREKKGLIEKIKRGHYKLSIGEDLEIDNFVQQFTPMEQALFRMISMNLRHGVMLKYIVDQLQKSSDDMFSVSSAAARVLKKYIKDGEIVEGKACPSCGNTDLIYEEGCIKCLVCSWSKCE